MLRARGRGAATTGACALRGDASTRAAQGWFATYRALCARKDCRLATAGNTEHRSNTLQRYGLRCRPVRAALPWRMPKRGRRCFARTEAQRQSGGASRWPPVRIRFVHHWIAQLGRASVLDTESRGFESRSKPDCKSGNRNDSSTTGNAPCGVPAIREGMRTTGQGSGGEAGSPPSRRMDGSGSSTRQDIAMSTGIFQLSADSAAVSLRRR